MIEGGFETVKLKEIALTGARLAILSALVCGLVFPVVITGIAQIAMPYQANGQIVYVNGKPIGSAIIAQSFTSPLFFHPRNNSASGVDPDITLNSAYSQVSRINVSTHIPVASLKAIISSNVMWTYWIAGTPYVSVLKLNMVLMEKYPQIYSAFVS